LRLLLPLQEGLLALVREDHHKGDLGEAQTHAQDLGGYPPASQHYPTLSKITLGVLPRLVGQGNEQGTLPGPVLPHMLAYGGLTAP